MGIKRWVFKVHKEFKFPMPGWVIIILVLMPGLVYIDMLTLGKWDAAGYLMVSMLELVLVFIGFVSGYNYSKKNF